MVNRRLVGLGVDVVSIDRITRVRSRRDLMTHVCAPEELKTPMTDLRAAQMWAGKEAVAKALGTGFWQAGVEWRDVRFDARWAVSCHGSAADLLGDSAVSVEFQRDGDRMLAMALRTQPV